jgi:hypothetical protein
MKMDIPGAGAQDAPRPSCQKAFVFLRVGKTKDQYGRHRVGQSVLARSRGRPPIRTAAGYKHGHGIHDNNEEQRGTLAPARSSLRPDDLNSVVVGARCL